jgi:hypothetical protein
MTARKDQPIASYTPKPRPEPRKKRSKLPEGIARFRIISVEGPTVTPNGADQYELKVKPIKYNDGTIVDQDQLDNAPEINYRLYDSDKAQPITLEFLVEKVGIAFEGRSMQQMMDEAVGGEFDGQLIHDTNASTGKTYLQVGKTFLIRQ